MAMVVIGGLLITLTYWALQRTVVPRVTAGQPKKKKQKSNMSVGESFSFLAKSPYIRDLATLVSLHCSDPLAHALSDEMLFGSKLATYSYIVPVPVMHVGVSVCEACHSFLEIVHHQMVSLQYPPYLTCCSQVVAYGISINLVEVTWKSKIKAQFPNPNEYSAFMGDFSSCTGAVTFLMMLLSRTIFKKYGWGVAALITPTVLLITGKLAPHLHADRHTLAAPPYLPAAQCKMPCH